MPSFKVEVLADDSGKWCGNELRFASRIAAEADARDLAARWYAVRDWRVVESEDPVNVDWDWVEVDGDLQRVKVARIEKTKVN